MNDELKDTKDFLQNISDNIHYFVRDSLPDNWVLLGQIVLKFLFLLVLVYVTDFILKFILNQIFRVDLPIPDHQFGSSFNRAAFRKFCAFFYIL